MSEQDAGQSAEELKVILPTLRRSTKRSIEKGPILGEEIDVPGRDGAEVPTWFHRAASAGRPVVFEFHGGGFALGDARKNGHLRDWVRDLYDVNVVGVGYRLSPENPFPAALHDAQDAICHYARHAAELGIDCSRVYLMGYSAGSSLSVAACLDAHAPWRDGSDEGLAGLAIKGLILHYPFFDAATDPHQMKTRDVDLPADLAAAFNVWYVGDADPKDPLISPVFATVGQLSALPPVHSYPVREDGGHDECVRFHEMLREAGVPERLTTVTGEYHGYIEDAANLRVYEETSFPETRDARPADFAQAAERYLKDGLTGFLGEPVRELPLNPRD